ncbi:MAG: acetyl-CoA carboxylase biotin carboxyl carrier protein subunit [Elusimicrobia bacterium]|nr:acetyl-CoA carboxylase biotin carboxyl carrier protein subunit [Elusimicrobiota bacterium]
MKKKTWPNKNRKKKKEFIFGTDIDIEEFLSVLGSTDVTEFEFEKGDIHLIVKKSPVGEIIGDTVNVSPSAGKEISAAEVRKPMREISSPAVGIFHFIEGDVPLVNVGDSVKKGARLGWVDSLGIPQEIKSPVSGKIAQIIRRENDVVEWGETLFRIEENV